jgi:acyl-coenzyme A thioesterase PaaI-like protein
MEKGVITSESGSYYGCEKGRVRARMNVRAKRKNGGSVNGGRVAGRKAIKTRDISD